MGDRPSKPLNPQLAVDTLLAAERLRERCQMQALRSTQLCAALVRERLGQIAPGEGADIPRIERAMIARAGAGLNPLEALENVATKGYLDYPWTIGCGRARPLLRAACAQLQQEFALACKRETCAKEGLLIDSELPKPVGRSIRPSAL